MTSYCTSVDSNLCSHKNIGSLSNIWRLSSDNHSLKQGLKISIDTTQTSDEAAGGWKGLRLWLRSWVR